MCCALPPGLTPRAAGRTQVRCKASDRGLLGSSLLFKHVRDGRWGPCCLPGARVEGGSFFGVWAEETCGAQVQAGTSGREFCGVRRQRFSLQVCELCSQLHD